MAASFFELDLVSHGVDRLGVRPDKGNAFLLERAREGGVLGQEAVAWMDRVGAGRLGSGDDLADIEIRLRGLRRTDRHGLVGHVDMQRVAVGLRIDGDRLDAEPLRGPHDPAGDLPPVGDEKLGEHGFPGPTAQAF